MPRRIAFLISLVVALACAPSAVADPSANADFGLSHKPVCPAAGQGAARCHAQVVVGPNGKPAASIPAYGAQDLQSAYGLTPSNYSSNTAPVIAIVDAFGYSNSESDLAAYRTKYNLGECTTDNGCFTKIDQDGGSNYPAANEGWAQESALDLDMASAICPSCRLLLVEGTTNSFNDLGTAVNTAAAYPGVVAISNSYGAKEFLGETNYESPYNHPSKAITVSSGDAGYGVEFPASSRYVTAVGGTSLRRDTSTTRGWTETAWSGAGSGCSAYIPRPGSWQSDPICTRRAVADVSAVADPATGVAVYGPSSGVSRWLKFGGTSAAAPIIAGVYALAGNSSALNSEFPYHNTSALNDVTSGSNGRCRTKLCTAVSGWDGPTGLGTPAGTAAF